MALNMKRARQTLRVATTLVIVGVAAFVAISLWHYYTEVPWTRDGQVRAQVANIAPQISGQITELHVHDNQFVHKGDVLYVIDPVDYQLALASAEATLAQRQEGMRLAQTEAQRRQELTTLSTSVEQKQQYGISAAQAVAALASAKAALSQAEVNLGRTQVRSTVNGPVNNLLLRVGDYANTGTANIQVVDADSYWVDGYFEETKIAAIHVGDRARVVLMGYRQPLPGHVGSITRAISNPNAAPGTQGLPSVNPVYTWVRLAQRIPVRVRLDTVPPGIVLAAGMTATVTIEHQGASGSPAGGR
jgi:multidrug resistance efflux pump